MTFRPPHSCALLLVKRALLSDTVSTGNSADRRRERIFRSFGAQTGHATARWGARLTESCRLVRTMVESQGRCREPPPEWLGPRLRGEVHRPLCGGGGKRRRGRWGGQCDAGTETHPRGKTDKAGTARKGPDTVTDMNINTRLCLIKSRGDAVEVTPGTSEKGICYAFPRVTLPSC